MAGNRGWLGVVALLMASCGGGDGAPAARWFGAGRQWLNQRALGFDATLECVAAHIEDAARCLDEPNPDAVALCLAEQNLAEACSEEEDLADTDDADDADADEETELDPEYESGLCNDPLGCADWHDRAHDCAGPECAGAGSGGAARWDPDASNRTPGDRDDAFELPPQEGFCTAFEFHCGEGECISEFGRCDGEVQCAGEVDERGCDECRGSDFHCGSEECIAERDRCDGIAHCRDASDERGCSCEDAEFQCGDRSCVDALARCDGVRDCRDGADEAACDGCAQATTFECGDGRCVPLTSQCNGVPDCRDGGDEDGCTRGCGGHEFTCDDGRCIPGAQRCNGVANCTDVGGRGSDEDEAGCERCARGAMRCDGACIAPEYVCDGNPDCAGHQDEADCGSCGEDELRCGNGECIAVERRCDGLHGDCVGDEDEADCSRY